MTCIKNFAKASKFLIYHRFRFCGPTDVGFGHFRKKLKMLENRRGISSYLGDPQDAGIADLLVLTRTRGTGEKL